MTCVSRIWSASTAAIVVLLVAMLLHADTVAAQPYKYRSYGKMVSYLKHLNATYPELLRVFVAQEKYSLPYPKELMCVEDDATGKQVPCQHFVVHMTNHSTLAAHPDRPQVFFSGALHGNERIGPITTIEMIALVAKLATAYADPQSGSTDSSPGSLHTQRWLHHLVNTRNVVITPMTNAYGYSHDVRTELDVDPNRDYNYMRSGHQCMQTMTSRVVNEIWRDHMFQLAITFHGGMRAVSYEWGSPNHYSPSNSHRSQRSPDDEAQAQLATTLAVFAGAFGDKTLYPTGTMNDIVYGVTGGMEDWAYAASWENQYVVDDAHKPFKPCEPTTFGGYAANKTVYNNITHRAFNILVETSNDKKPVESHLGFFEDLYATELDFYSTKKGIPSLGHVSQNVRMALMLIDMVEPYLRWVHAPLELATATGAAAAATAEEKEEPSGSVPTTPRDLFPPADLFVDNHEHLVSMGCGAGSALSAQVASCNTTKCHILHDQGKPLKLQVAWEVLGALTVDETKVQLASDDKFTPEGIIWQSALQKGSTRRFFDLSDPVAATPPDNTDTMGTSLFVSCLDLHAQVAKKFYLRTVAVVDQNWKQQVAEGEDEPSPYIRPQSHYVNARTNPAWQEEWNGHQVKGSLYWYSPTMEVTVETVQKEENPEPVSDTITASKPVATTAPGPVVMNGTDASAAETGETDDNDDDDEVAVEPDFEKPDTNTPAAATTTTTKPPATTEPVLTTVPVETTAPVETTVPPVATAASVSTTAAAPLVTTTATPSTTADDPNDQTLTGVQKTDLKATNKSNSPLSLVNYGYLTLGLGGLIITVTLTYLYKRVFRSKPRAYMHINRQSNQRSPMQGGRSARGGDDDEDEDDL